MPVGLARHFAFGPGAGAADRFFGNLAAISTINSSAKQRSASFGSERFGTAMTPFPPEVSRTMK